MMKIIYSKHIKNRLRLRSISDDLPRAIFERATERYIDNETGHLIATTKAELYSKVRDVMVAYVMKNDCAKLLTIHPLKEGQKESRIGSGRWREI